jgi:hypothetical protein
MAISSNTFSIGKEHITTIAKTAKTLVGAGFAVALIAAALFQNIKDSDSTTATTIPTVTTDRTAS